MKRPFSPERKLDCEIDVLDLPNDKNMLTHDKSSIVPNFHYWREWRIVEPYYYEHVTHVKGRWLERSLLDVFQHEFRDMNEAYFIEAYKRRNLFVTCGKSQMKLYKSDEEILGFLKSYLLKQNQQVHHRVHRHELPIPEYSLRYAVNDKIVKVDKVSGIPVHPTGKYFYNSLLEDLRLELRKHNSEGNIETQEKSNDGIKKRHLGEKTFELGNLNRIDRLTSGVMLFLTDRSAMQAMQKTLTSRQIKKVYLAQVKGDFTPPSLYGISELGDTISLETENDALKCMTRTAIYDDISRLNLPLSDAPAYLVDIPMLHYEGKIALSGVVEACDEAISFETPYDKSRGRGRNTGIAKRAVSIFKKLAFDGTHSLVLCYPLTGRTHQLRVHLQYCGFPIVNDPLYGHPDWPSGFVTYEQLRVISESILGDIVPSHSLVTDCKSDSSDLPSELKDLPAWFDPECLDCQRQYQRSLESVKSSLYIPLVVPMLSNYSHTDLHLHALCYDTPDGAFSSLELPSWAKTIS